MGDKKQNSTGTTEKDVSTALVKLSGLRRRSTSPPATASARSTAFGPRRLRPIKQALERDNFTTAPLNLVTTRAVPDDAAEVVIAGPTNPFLPEEKDALRAYLEGGGKLIALVGPGLARPISTICCSSTRCRQRATSSSIRPSAFRRIRACSSSTSTARTRSPRTCAELTFYPGVDQHHDPGAARAASYGRALAQSSDQSWGNTNPQQIQRQPTPIPRGRCRWRWRSRPMARRHRRATDGHERAVAWCAHRGHRHPELISNNSFLQQVAGQPGPVPRLRQLAGRTGQPDRHSRARDDVAARWC